MRVLTVTGTSTASTTALTIASATSGWRNREEPPPFLVILLTGQPILISIVFVPWATAFWAAWAIKSGRQSNSWILIGSSLGAIAIIVGNSCRWWSSLALTISVYIIDSGAYRLTNRRNTKSVTPDRGDCKTRLWISTLPILSGLASLVFNSLDNVGIREEIINHTKDQNERWRKSNRYLTSISLYFFTCVSC